MLRKLFFCCALFLGGLSAALASESEGAAEARAKGMLAKAVAHFQEKGEIAFAAFSRQGAFIDGEIYVFVLNKDGVMVASGGSSAALLNRNLSDLEDASGKRFVREMLEVAARDGKGQVEYRWLNRRDARVERKISHIERVGEHVIGVGFYLPYGSAEQAKALLARAAEAVEKDPEAAFRAFNAINGKYVEDDLYVFVIGLEDGRFRAHGGVPRLVGTSALQLKDADGNTFIPKMLDTLKSADSGEARYTWRNTVTGELMTKHAYLSRVGPYLVAVGYYLK